MPAIEVQMLGPLSVARHGTALPLPASRKVRGLLAYLLLSPHAVQRGQLCELLWDVPNDPRGELRWSLSKIRGLVDEPARSRVDTRGDTVALDLADVFVDAVEVGRAVTERAALSVERLHALAAMFTGDFLEGLEIDRSPAFNTWVTAQRRQFRSYHAALLEQLVKVAPDSEVQFHLEQWLVLAPFDQHVHELLLSTLARHGQIREGDEHLTASVRLFESEGLDSAPLRQAWQIAKTQVDSPPRAQFIVSGETASPGADRDHTVTAARRGSIAVMPFTDLSKPAAAPGGAAGALARDVITRLAKLRSLFVIAQGTMFALHEQGITAEAAARMLNVDYVASGSVYRGSNRLAVMVELTETRTSHIVWSETFDHRIDDALLVLEEIGDRIVASIASEIEANERNRAVLKSPRSLDAWEAHHRGLWHMYRFNKPDNDQARHFFDMAVRLDPTFARAYAGLSFTHFQSAFQGWEERETQVDRAFETAGHSLMADDRDPAAHWAMGRALFLRGRHDQSVVELQQAIELSPNFALGHYMLGLVHAQTGDPAVAIVSSDRARQLSPFDPMLFAPLGARAMAMVRMRRFEEAAEWGVKAASRPNAHAHIHAIAAFALALAGQTEQARVHFAAIHRIASGYRFADFIAAMQCAPDGEKLFREAANRIGLD